MTYTLDILGDNMVQAVISISKHTNQILNIVKAKYDLKTKSDAIDVVTQLYEEEIMEPELRPEFVKKMLKLKKEKSTRYSSVQELRDEIEIA